ncbi:MAG: ATP-binding cassette domain-containing protein, partial [Bacteroidetes bacterium]|nr:ATP-binding cassette domain-containing protein [Bacteroidota bacterium]
MIELKNVNKTFVDKQVLFDINATFLSGKNNLIIGASGGGKSVLMKSMVGLERPDTGSILFDSRDILHLEDQELREVRREIGMLFQGTALFDSLNVEQNVAFPLEMFSKMTADEIKDRVNFCLKRVNLENINKKYPSEISGGMKKRVGIARAIALDIKYLFCD